MKPMRELTLSEILSHNIDMAETAHVLIHPSDIRVVMRALTELLAPDITVKDLTEDTRWERCNECSWTRPLSQMVSVPGIGLVCAGCQAKVDALETMG